MPNRIGLNYLRGFDSLSDAEKDAFLKSQSSILSVFKSRPEYYNKAVNILYDNYKFKKLYGQKDFDAHPGYESRNNLLKARVISKAFHDNFSKNSNYEELNNGLDLQGKLDLLRNKNYLTDNEIVSNFKKNKVKYKENMELMSKAHKWEDPWDYTPFIDRHAVGKNPMEAMKDEQESNKNILDKLYSQVQKRRENNVSNETNAIYNAMLEANAKGGTSLAKLTKDFDTIANSTSPYYSQFKDSKWLKNYNNEDKLKDYAKLMALSQKYGDGVATAYLNRSMQNKVAKAQDWAFTGNTLMGVATTMVSDLGSQIAMINTLKYWDNPEILGKINQGYTPKYDEKTGKFIGYVKNNDIWSNPAYWNDMYMYNTFSPTEIETIKQKGGVSKNINVREYGWNPNEHFISFDTAYEGIKQGGHILAGLLESAAGGVVGRVAGKMAGVAGQYIMRGAQMANMSAKAMNALSKTGNVMSKVATKTHNLAMAGLAGLNGPQGEAMGTFNEQLENNIEVIKENEKARLKKFYKNIDYNSNEARQSINAIYSQLKQKDLKRVSSASREGRMRPLPMSDETLMKQAKQIYTNNLLSVEKNRLEKEYKKAELEASTNAAKTYMVNWAMDWAKEAIMAHGVQKFKMAKGARIGEADNFNTSNIIKDIKTGGVRRVVDEAGKEVRRVGAKNLAKGAAKQIVSGFADEYLDGINANFSEAAGSNAFKQYINNQYNPGAYKDTIEGVYGNLISGINGAFAGLTDRENLYEGFIGGITPFISFMPNIGSPFLGKEAWNAVVKGKDMLGNKMSIASRMSYLINNPLLEEYSMLKRQDMAIDNNINNINKIIKQYKDNGGIDDAAKAMSATSDYSSDYGNPKSSVMSAEDNKLFNAFNLMTVAKILEGMEGGTKSAFYEQTLDRLKRLSEGNLNSREMDEEVTKFLADPDNKSILDNNTPEQARVIAEGRLRRNSQFFMDLYKKKEEIETKLKNSPSLQRQDPRLLQAMEYQLLAKDNWKERLKLLEQETGTSFTNTEQEYHPNLEMIYGSPTSRKVALKARERDSEQIDKAQRQIEIDNKKSNETIESLQEQKANATTEDERNGIEAKIKQEENLIKSRILRSNQLKIQQGTIKEEINVINDLIKDTTGKPILDTSSTFTVDGILNSDARTRAEILNDNNRKRFTKKQQAVIDKAKAKLTQQDPTALQKIQDAGTLAHRIEDADKVYNTLLNNGDLAIAYFDAQDELRNRNAISESLQEDIDKNYSKISKAIEKKGKDGNTDLDNLKNTLLPMSSAVINAYMEDNPDNSMLLQPYLDLSNLDNDVIPIIREMSKSDAEKDIFLTNYAILRQRANNRDELMNLMEKAIDDDAPEETRKEFKDILDELQSLGYQRDATVLENREKRKEREAKQKSKKTDNKAKETTQKESKDNSEEYTPEGGISIEDNNREEEVVPNDQMSAVNEEEDDTQVSGWNPLEYDNDEDVQPEHSLNPNGSEREEEIAEGGNNPLDWIDPDENKLSSNTDVLKESSISGLMSKEAKERTVVLGSIKGSVKGRDTSIDLTATLHVNGDKRTIDFMLGGAESTYDILLPNNDSMERFSIKKMVSDGNDWYFIGNFEGRNEERLKVPENYFNTKNSKSSNNDDSNITTVEYRSASGTHSIQAIPVHFKDLKPGDKFLNDSKIICTFVERLNDKEAIIIDGDSGRKAIVGTTNSGMNWEYWLKKDPVIYKIANNKNDTEKATKEKARIYKVDKNKEYSTSDILSSKGKTKEDAKGNIYAESPSIQDDIKNLPEEERQNIDIIPTMVKDNEELNREIEAEQATTPSTNLSGNAMSEWKSGNNYDNVLDGFGRLEHKQGRSENDHMNKFYAFTKEWHIQDTIDHDLARILEKNPNIKVKLMRVNDKKNITDMFLVIDYDDSVNPGITLIHRSNNGVITSNGAKYLVIGTGGYASTNKAAKELYEKVWKGKLYTKSFGTEGFFTKHPEEQYYVMDDYYTYIVPGSIIPGFRVKQLEDDEKGDDKRDVLEMLKDPKRNPMRLTIESLGWGIQYKNDFKTVNIKSGTIMCPSSAEHSAGNVYVLFQAANGKYFPAHINDCRYKDLREGQLKDSVNEALNNLCSVDLETRRNAIIKLSSLFVFKQKNSDNTKAGDCILTNDTGFITFLKEGNTVGSIKVTDTIDRSKIFDLFSAMNPRVRVSITQLNNVKSLEVLSEAGALTTDLAELALAGSSYQIYGIDSEGKILKPKESKPSNSNKDDTKKKDKDVHEHRVRHYNNNDNSNKYYVYNDLTGKYYQDGTELDEEKDASLIKELNYIRCKSNYQFISRFNNTEYYIVNDSKEHPLVIEINRTSNKVKELDESTSRKKIEDYNKSNSTTKRQVNVEKEIKKDEKKPEPSTPETGVIDNNNVREEEKPEVNLYEDGITGAEDMEAEGDVYNSTDITDEDNNKSSQDNELPFGESSSEGGNNINNEESSETGSTSTMSFTELYNNPLHKKTIQQVLKKKKLYSKNIDEVIKKLKSLKIETDNIDSSENGINTWIETVKNCR